MNKTITEVINTDYHGYAKYVLENRAIPSCIDGMKPVHRKLIYAMLNEHKGKKTKVADLGGISKYAYHHGESSAMGAAITLAAPWNNNVPVFKGHGTFGSRLVQEAAAPRYIYASLGEDFYKYFTDFEVCDKHSDVDNPEPQTYLPLIPWVLVNGIEGIAVGFACKYLPHDPKVLVKACLRALEKDLDDGYNIVPSFPNYTGKVILETSSKVVTQGVVTRSARNRWLITEAPWGFDREQMYNHLIKLQEDDKIVDFDDDCDGSGFKFEVKVDSANDKKCSVDPIKFFKLEKAFTENYTALDEFGKLKVFNNKAEIINYFVKYRLKKVQDMINFELDKEQGYNEWLTTKRQFITAVLESNKKQFTKAELIALANTENEDWVNRLIRIPLFDITVEAVKELDDLIKKSNGKIREIKKRKAVDVYKAQLEELL